MPLQYAIGLLLLFYVLVVLEFFIPSGGILGAGAALAAVAAIVVAFTHSLGMGATVTIILGVTTPLLFAVMVRVWPRTSIGRMLLNRRPGELAPEPAPKTTLSGEPLTSLEGKLGVAKSDLLPSGRVRVDHHNLDAVSVGMPIERGTPVVVTRVQGSRVTVRPATADEITEQTSDQPSLGTVDLDEFLS
ncbi:MAG: NfeD family protein [Planctomycetota bacterium]